MEPNLCNDPPSLARDQAGEILNHALADEYALSAATRDYHWNVTGPHFRSLREIFDQQYHQLDCWIEAIGERARRLGVAALGGWNELMKAAHFTPVAAIGLTANDMMAGLIALHDGMAERLRAEAPRCGDAVTTDLLNALVEYHETTAWMLGELLDSRQLAQA